MKQNKNEELQSRRQFFKRAAKTALPILAAVAISQVPMIANASVSASGCTGTCYSGCIHGCKGCEYTCSGGCKHSCKGVSRH